MVWLIAEDEMDILNLVSMMCRLWGHNPMTFESGQKVWDWLDGVEAGTTVDGLPEFALLDIRMPGKRGNEVANRIRTIPALKHIPIVVMTAFSLNDDDRKAIIEGDGVDHIVYKPLPGPNELQEMINEVIRKKQASKES